MRPLVVASLRGSVALGLFAMPAQAAQESAGQQAVLGAGSVLGTLVDAPVKTSYCILGAVSSGFAFPIAGPKTAGNIASSTSGGPGS